MTISGICQSCGKVSKNLKPCMFCGARVCSNCLIPGNGCKLCKGRIMQK